MPRDGAIIFGDLENKLAVPRVTYSKCPRDRRYILFRLTWAHERNAKVIDWVGGDYCRLSKTIGRQCTISAVRDIRMCRRCFSSLLPRYQS